MEKKEFHLLGGLTLTHSLLIFLGGIMGFILKKSVPSLVSGLFFGLLLLFSGIQTLFHRRIGPILTLFTLTVLTLLFSYRFALTKTVAPAGILSILTGGMLIFQVFYFQKTKRIKG